MASDRSTPLISRRGFAITTLASGCVASLSEPAYAQSKAPGPTPNRTTTGPTHTQSLLRGASTVDGRWDSFVRENVAGFDVIQAIQFTVSPDSVGPNADIAIFADVVRIRGTVRLLGRTLMIFARTIVWEPGAIIDSSGPDAKGFDRRALDGQTIDQVGADGAQGQAGGNAGCVSLVARTISGSTHIKLSGGTGGPGQQGGTGGIGKTGPTGQSAAKNRTPGNGGIGYKGARGGVGGPGGIGGNAGILEIYTVEKLNQSPIIESSVGKAGSVGAPGKGGRGGVGGNPGDPCFITIERSEPNGFGRGSRAVEYCYKDKATTGPDGPIGDDGAVQQAQSPNGKAGTNIIDTLSQVDAGQWALLSQIRMSLHAARILLLNRDVSDLSGQLQWITDVATSSKAGNPPKNVYGKWFPMDMLQTGELTSDWAAIRAAASALLARYRLGLDPYGYSPQYVGSLTFDQLKSFNQERLASAATVEAEYDRFLNDKENLDSITSGLEAVWKSASQGAVTLETESNAAATSADRILDEIQVLSTQLALAQRDVEIAQREFQRAVASLGGCSLGDLIKFVSGVVAVANGLGAGYAALGDSFTEINTTLPKTEGFVSKLKVISSTFEKAKLNEHFTKIQEGFQDAKESWSKDETKIVISEDAFEEQLKPFEDLLQAEALKAKLNQFVSLAKVRNQRQLDYSQEILRADGLRTEAVALRSEANRAKTLFAQSGNPALAEELVFLRGYLQSSKLRVLETLELQRRALMYTTLSAVAPQYRLTRVVDLRRAYDELSDEWIRRLDDRNREALKYEAEFDIDFVSVPALKQNLQQSGSIIFSIPINYPTFNRGGTAFVAVSEVTLDLDYVKSKSNRLTLRLEHLGVSTLRDADGAKMKFTHRARPTTLSYEFRARRWQPTISVANNLGGSEGRYLYLSPFATWRLAVQDIATDQPDWSKLRALTLKFKGHMIPSNKAPQVRKLQEFTNKRMSTI